MLVIETPIPFSLYWVNESQTIDFRSCPGFTAPVNADPTWSPSIFIPILSVIKFVQFLIYGDLHLPLGPSLAGPISKHPDLALPTPAGGGNATQPPVIFIGAKLSNGSWLYAKFRFSTRHPLLT